jgi:hypothetical protein
MCDLELFVPSSLALCFAEARSYSLGARLSPWFSLAINLAGDCLGLEALRTKDLVHCALQDVKCVKDIAVPNVAGMRACIANPLHGEEKLPCAFLFSF